MLRRRRIFTASATLTSTISKAHNRGAFRKSSTTRLPFHHSSRLISVMSKQEQSSERNILNTLQDHRHNKWGWVVYRTAYTEASDRLWPQFQTRLKSFAQEWISDSDTPAVLDMLDYKFVSDPALNGADRATLRKRHHEWRTTLAQAEQPADAEPVWPSGLPRYAYCVEADEAIMQNVVDAASSHLPGEAPYGYLKLVHCVWPDDLDDSESWMLADLHLMGAYGYDLCYDTTYNVWWALYREPPTISTS